MTRSTITPHELATAALEAARHCIRLVVDGDSAANADGHASTDRKNNAQAALALAQAAKTLTVPQRRQQ